MKPVFFGLLIWILPYSSSAQQILSGALFSINGTAVSASITLTDSSGSVLAYSTSDAKGRYRLFVSGIKRLDSLFIQVSCIGYFTHRKKIVAGVFNYDFQMEIRADDLPEVLVKKRASVESEGDTLSYDASSFSKVEDRTIGEVMKHMPGITIAENGQISFNGKVIRNLYIDGDDLLDGKYNLALKSITKEMIRSVDVLKNFQFINVLKNKTYSDDVAINLTLKNPETVKLSGDLMLGGGLPSQYDGAVNSMLFNHKLKMLNALKVNNSGTDYGEDLTKLSVQDPGTGEIVNAPAALLSTGNVGAPDLAKKNYYLNNSGSINLNNLYNFKGLQFRTNLQFLGDRNYLAYESRVDTYLNNDTIQYRESQRSRRKINLLSTAITAMANKKSYYLNNSTQIQVEGDRQRTDMLVNGNTLDPHLQNRLLRFSNNLQLIPALRNGKLINLNWQLDHYNRRNDLFIDQGVLAEILNQGLAYRSAEQGVKLPGSTSQLSASYQINSKNIFQRYEAGMLNERQILRSSLVLSDSNGMMFAYANDSGNNLKWKRDKVYLNANYDWRAGDWQAGVSLPLSLQLIRYQDASYYLDTTNLRMLFNPSFKLKIPLNQEDYFTANVGSASGTGTFTDVYRGIILTNYRSIRANDTYLQQRERINASIAYNFQRSIKMLFANFQFSYSATTNNSILSSVISDKIQRTVLLPYRNKQNNISLNAGLSKYIFAFKSGSSFHLRWARSYYPQILNNQMVAFVNDNFQLSTSIESSIQEKLTINWRGSGIWNTGRQANEKNKSGVNAWRLEQLVTITGSFYKRLLANFSTRHTYNTQGGGNNVNYLFADAGMRYKLIKLRTDLEFELSNLANVKQYELYQISINQLSESRFALRGRMAILRVRFNL